MFLLLLVAVLVGAFLLSSHSNREGGSSMPEPAVYHKIDAKLAKQMMDNDGAYTLLDVRTDEEFAENRINGAVLIPDYEIAGRAGKELTNKKAAIFVYCRTGRRSANAAKQLVSMGYTNVYDFGGIVDWPYETVSKKH